MMMKIKEMNDSNGEKEQAAHSNLKGSQGQVDKVFLSVREDSSVQGVFKSFMENTHYKTNFLHFHFFISK